MSIQLICTGDQGKFKTICDKWQLEHDPNANLALVQTDSQLELRKLDEAKLGAVSVNFTDGTIAYRRKHGGGRGEAIAKAVGIKKDYLPRVLDATAGLGRDAFVLAAIGCHVTLLERNPVVAALLEDGLARAYLDHEIGLFMQQRMQLLSHQYIFSLTNDEIEVDVVYLDPMYPHKNKSALVKKEMRIFQSLIGADLDADELLAPALKLASKRVVVKRPAYAEHLNQQKPQIMYKTKNHRFDVYLTAN